jgi:FixJ family two-component response regulator
LHELVAVVDDDVSVRESLPDLLRDLGYATSTFVSAEEFIAADCVADIRCLILDIAMPGMSGPELYRALVREGFKIPVIFITAESVPLALLQEAGVNCLIKPFSKEDLRDALAAALLRT